MPHKDSLTGGGVCLFVPHKDAKNRVHQWHKFGGAGAKPLCVSLAFGYGGGTMREYSHQEFRTFLSHYRDDEAVGIDGDRPVNPLTRFLREHTGNEQVWCGLIETMYVDKAKKVKIEDTPDWSAGFLFLLQNRGQATGLACREVLDVVTRGVA